MDEELSQIEVRLWALETLVAFQFAAQHLQSSDPAAAIKRLQTLLIERAHESSFNAADADHLKAASAELEKSVERILAIQEQLPRRLVD
jgi:hypothetical protein